MPSLLVELDSAGARLDAFLSHHFPTFSRRAAQEVIASGEVLVNGRPARKGTALRAGDRVDVPQDLAAQRSLPPAPDLAVTILYEDADVVALDKPAGLAAHALRFSETQTVANFLVARYPEMRETGASPLEAGLVHRLDTDTTGVLLAARNPAAYAELRRQFREHRVTKEYVALVRGDVAAAGEIDDPLMHDPGDRRRMRIVRRGASGVHGRPALTRYRPLERYGSETLLKVEIVTGVMHQIRVHLAAAGHPIVGDPLYGNGPTDAPRQLLHAARVVVTHPGNGARLAISCPLPADFAARLEHCRRRERPPRPKRPPRRHG